MTNEQHVSSCPEYAGNLAELALGILTGRDRAATLAHVESCANCAEELEQLARAADAVVLVAPEADPPIGFEVSLFSRMGVSDESRLERGRLSRVVPGRRPAVGLAVGWRLGARRRVEHRLVDRIGGTDAGAPRTGRGGGHGRPDGERRIGRPGVGLRGTDAVAVDDPGRLLGARPGDLPGGDGRRGNAHHRLVRGRPRLRSLGRNALGNAPGRPSGPGGVAQRDGDRHRLAGLTPRLSSGTCPACTDPRPARRCSPPAPVRAR